MYHIQVEIKLVDDETGEQAKSRFGGTPVGTKSSFYPRIVDVIDGEEVLHKLETAVVQTMHLGTTFYRVGTKQANL